MSALQRFWLLFVVLLLNGCTHLVSVVVAERSDQFVQQTIIGRLIEDGTVKLERESSGDLDELERASRTYKAVTGSEFFKNKKARVLRLVVDRERDSMVFELSNCEYFSIRREPATVKDSEAKRIATPAGDFALVESGVVARCAR